ncbi:MAG: Ig-like domain-containing protein [Trueperaceae bacterium]|nr:Ig-like domain-containing protein [Trueperaceae bacterium]
MAALTALIVAACSGPQSSVDSVTVTAPASLLVGRSAQAEAVVEVTGTAGTEVNWSSSNTSVATVSSTGLVSALSEGTVTITATSEQDDTKSDSASIDITSALRNTTILYYRNGLQGEDSALAALTDAADNFGATIVETNDDNFVTDLDAEPNLVVYLRQQSSGIPDSAEQALLDWVDDGGALVFATWRTTGDDILAQAAAMDAEFTGDINWSSMEIEDPFIAAGLTSTTIPVIDPGWSTFSVGLRALGDAVELAHYYDDTPELTTDAALVSGHDGKTMFMGFLSDTVEGDDGSRLLRNIFEYVLLAALP